MPNYSIYSYQNDLSLDESCINQEKEINILEKKHNKATYKTILFNQINNQLEKTFVQELLFFFHKLNLNQHSHIFIVGMGSDTYTVDSVGPTVLNYVHVNAYLENLGIKLSKNKISALKPGVLGETGILTEKTIVSLTQEIKPDVVILIDSFICNNVNYLNKSIEINDYGLSPGIGIKGINSVINQNTLHIPVIVIGVTTALLIKFQNNSTSYILSSKDIDEYTENIAKLIGKGLNKAISRLS